SIACSARMNTGCSPEQRMPSWMAAHLRFFRDRHFAYRVKQHRLTKRADCIMYPQAGPFTRNSKFLPRILSTFYWLYKHCRHGCPFRGDDMQLVLAGAVREV